MTESIATWYRVEPYSRTTDLDVGLAAEIADPLFLLMRQWQLGELTGEDGGTPIAVDVSASWSMLTRYRPEGTSSDPVGPAQTLTGRSWPLEALVEAEGVIRPSGDLRGTPWTVAVRAGRSLGEQLQDSGFTALAAVLAVHPETTFEAAPVADTVEGVSEARYRALLARRVIDGARVLNLLTGPGLPADVLAGVDTAALAPVLAGWQQAVAAEFGLAGANRVSPAWVTDRLEYAFSVAAPPLPGDTVEPVLVAPEYDGTGLSWSSLDIAPSRTLGAAADVDLILDGEPVRATRVRTLLPSRLTFAGMPADRFWEMEDAAVAIGRVGAGPTDLARMLALDFAEVYGVDWYLAPVEVPVGCVARIDWVVVRDTFGVATLVGTSVTQAGDGVGRQFQPSLAAERGAPAPPDGDVALLVVLPSALSTITADPREDLALQRDEAANLVWSIERRVMGPSGRGVDRPWLAEAFDLPAEISADPHAFVWRLATPVAPTWTPMIAMLDSARPRMLRKARLLDTATTDLRAATSQLLADLGDLHEEEVGGAGLRLRITEQLARWHDGRTVVWRGRERRAASGEVTSGLQFDAATPAAP